MSNNFFNTKKKYTKHGYLKSGYEIELASQLESAGLPFKYEPGPLIYSVRSTRQYTPDYLLSNGIIIEAKGWFDAEARKKMAAVKQDYPQLDIRMLFSGNPEQARCYKNGKMTYSDWCNKYGFPYACGLVPKAWINEKLTKKRKEAIESIGFDLPQ